MATDVEVSPKHTIIDLVKTPPGKAKGIKDFFSVSSKSTFVNHRNSDGFQAKLDIGTPPQVLADRPCNIEIDKEKDVDGNKAEEVISTKCENHKKVTEAEAKQTCSSSNAQGKASSGPAIPVGRKKKSLSISKKPREKKKDTPSQPAEEERDQKEEKAVADDVGAQSMLQEMDYGDFLKTLMQNQNDSDTPVVNVESDEKESIAEPGKNIDTDHKESIAQTSNKEPCTPSDDNEPDAQCLEKSKETKNCSEKKNDTKKLACKKKSKMPNTDSSSKEPTIPSEDNEPDAQCHEKSKETQNSSDKKGVTKKLACKKKNKTPNTDFQETKDQSQTNSKSKKPANAFSILMQAKVKTAEPSSEENDCVEANTIPSDGKCSSPVSINEDAVDQPEAFPTVTTSSTPSVLNFFTKTSKKARRDSSDSGDSVTVEVDVHYDPSEQKVAPVQKKSCKPQAQKAEKRSPNQLAVDNEIVFLGSETIEPEEEDKRNKKRKRIFFKPATPLDSPEKLLIEQNTKVAKTEGKQDRKTEIEEAAKSESIRDVEKKNAFLKDLTSPAQTAKTAQPTLQFGKGGKLTMNNSVIAKSASKPVKSASENHEGTPQAKKKTASAPSDNHDGTTQKKGKLTMDKDRDLENSCSPKPSDRTTARTKLSRKRPRAEEKDGSPGKDEQGHRGKAVSENAQETSTTGKVTRLRRQMETGDAGSDVSKGEIESGTDVKEESSSDSKDFTPNSKKTKTGKQSRAHELLMRARQQKMGSKKKTPEHQINGHSPSKSKNIPEQQTAKRRGRPRKTENLKTEKEDQKAEKQDPKAEKEEQKKSALKPEQKEDGASDEQFEAEPGVRRSSRRLAQQQKVRQEEEEKCISLDSNSSSTSDEAPTPRKKSARSKKGKEKCISVDSDSDSNSSSDESPTPRKKSTKKPVGKLAPIFAKKSKDDAPKQPPEDPEVVRRRREFLLSGVPTELKRQAVCTAPSVPVSDFAPFPEISHVQQRELQGTLDVWSLVRPANMARLCRDTTADCEEVGGSALDWASLGWNPVIDDESCALNCDMLEPVSVVGKGEITKALVSELQQRQLDFPFSDVCERLAPLFSPPARQEAVQVPKVSGSKKRRRKEPEVVIVDEPEDSTAAQSDRDAQWSDMLQPRCAGEVIGNSSTVRRLRYWLEEWRALIQREARLSARTASCRDDSDFAYSDSEDEECQLCNTMLLVGPHGAGKTAAVYALAQQLSYKVFEVNASSSRQGRHILAQLQEATQSHQVAQNKEGAILSPPPPLNPALTLFSQPEQPAEKKTGKKSASAVPKAFASFFKKSEPVTDMSKAAPKTDISKADKRKGRGTLGTPKKEEVWGTPKETKKSKMSAESSTGSKKRRGSDDVEIVEETISPKKGSKKRGKGQAEAKEGEEGSVAGCLNLTSTSLILFDEVDLVFAEDTGFLQTVQHFISTTKIPIILTTTRPHFHNVLPARMETLVFTAPPMASVTSYLQSVCVAAGMRTSREEMWALADLCRGDLRRCLLTLHFLALSGGGRLREARPAHLKPSQKTAGNGAKPASENSKSKRASAFGVTAGSDSDSNDFVCLKPARKKSRRIIDDDDGDSSRSSARLEVKVEGQSDAGEVIAADKLPEVHLQLCHSVLGVAANLHDLLTQGITGPYDGRQLKSLVEECIKLRGTNPDILQHNLLQLLPLPKTSMPPTRWLSPPAPTTTGVKRKRIRSDLYDSEGSDDDDIMQTASSAKPVTGQENGVDDKSSDVCESSHTADSISVKAAENDDDHHHHRSEAEVKKSEGVSSQNSAEAGGEQCENSNKEQEVKHEAESTKVNNDQESKQQGSEKKDSFVQSGSTSSQGGSQSRKSTLKGSRTCTDHGLSSRLLSSFARHYDNVSSMDLGLSHLPTSPYPRDRCHTLPGIEDLPGVEEREGVGAGAWREVGVQVEVLSGRRLWQQVSSAVSSWRQESGEHALPSCCSLPLASSASSSTLLTGHHSALPRVPEAYGTVVSAVTEKLPCHVGSKAVVLDYLPMLRSVSQAEHCRQVAKAKRRFHHHFDNIGLCLDRSTISALCEEFPAQQTSL